MVDPSTFVAARLPVASRFDFIIVGGGTAGCVLASRLSEDPSCSVLLLEAGGDVRADDVPEDIADRFPSATGNTGLFQAGSTARNFANHPALPYARPRILGGGSCVNGMIALRGLAADYDGWAEAGATGWASRDVLPWFDRLLADRATRDDEPCRYRTALVEDGLWPRWIHGLGKASAKNGLPVIVDINNSESDGFFAIPNAFDGPHRQSSVTSYLPLAVRQRKNLMIVANIEVDQITTEAGVAVGVRLAGGPDKGVVRGRNIVLSAGGIGSPSLLLRSGIGPAAMLARAGVPVVVDRAGVGRNLQNHCYAMHALSLTQGQRAPDALRAFGLAGLRATSSGAGSASSDIFMFAAGRVSGRRAGTAFAMLASALYYPYSRGQVSLEPGPDGPRLRVDFDMLSDERDRGRMRQAIDMARQLLCHPACRQFYQDAFLLRSGLALRQFDSTGIKGAAARASALIFTKLPRPVRHRIISSRFGANAHIEADQLTEADLFSSVAPMGHPAGSCAIGAKNDPQAVVDPNCAVTGIQNLFVADASIMPIIPRANTNLPTVMIAERAAGWLCQK